MKNNIYACLEIGCAEARVVVCSIQKERLYVLSEQALRSEGIVNGAVVDTNLAVQTLKALKVNIEADLNQRIQQVLLAVPSVDLTIEKAAEALILDGGSSVDSRHVKQLLRKVLSQPAAPGRVNVNVIPRWFQVDGKEPAANPIGQAGSHLAFESQKIAARDTLVYSLINVAELAGFRIADIMAGNIAEAQYIQNAQRISQGICQVNIGHSLTTLTISHGNRIAASKSISIGGQSVTEQIRTTFGLDDAAAEKLKVGFARIGRGDDSREIIFMNEVDGGFVRITREMLEHVVTIGYQTIFKAIKQYLNEHAYKSDELQYVFTGGAAEVEGIEGLISESFGQDSLVFRPNMLGVRHAKYTKLIGMAICSHELALLIGQGQKVIDFDRYGLEEKSEPVLKTVAIPVMEKAKPQEKTFVDHKLEQTGVLSRLLDRMFDEKAE